MHAQQAGNFWWWSFLGFQTASFHITNKKEKGKEEKKEAVISVMQHIQCVELLVSHCTRQIRTSTGEYLLAPITSLCSLVIHARKEEERWG